ncbi:chorismate synthase [Acidipropionibacterium jensenii]|uniref:chorismate synthase n=1 Tax=Acidipropionibacterium jensenii TaxID=1749 RepID=UPI000BC319A2|nr:chorismate synthase [Acidipropionibacterium jensenii]AZZ42118.1 chorismate synthase [Acidipropionibacterium jensenii]QCV88909.1 chorismate synthase [Acidipropionibacterium jensenii]
MLRYITAGESHGEALIATMEGIPAHVEVGAAEISEELRRRRLGVGRGARMAFEADELALLAGFRHGETLGSPIAVRIGNTEWPKWREVMNPGKVDPQVLVGQARGEALTRPRPGHADLAGMQKYDFAEARPILERASARETAARVTLGTIAKAFLRQALGVEILSHVVQLGPVVAPAGLRPGPDELARIDADPVRCADPETSARMIEAVEECRRDGDTMGGIVEVLAWGLPAGLGSHTQGNRRLDSRLAGALMGIQAIKGVELGDGFALAGVRGSAAHDEMEPTSAGVHRLTDHSGGTEGGISTGELLRVRAAMKPIATVPRALRTLDTATGEPARANHQRSDITAVPAAGVVAEAMVALVLAECALEKFGGDSVAETRRNADAYLARLDERHLEIAPHE